MITYRWPLGLDPFAGLRFMQRELERLAGPQDGRSVGGSSYPAVNIFNGPDDIIVECELAGVKKESLDVSITGETLAIKGTKQAPAGEDKFEFHRKERGVGDFSRTIVLPEPVEPSRIDASLANGILTVRLPKSESARPRQIKVK